MSIATFISGRIKMLIRFTGLSVYALLVFILDDPTTHGETGKFQRWVGGQKPAVSTKWEYFQEMEFLRIGDLGEIPLWGRMDNLWITTDFSWVWTTKLLAGNQALWTCPDSVRTGRYRYF